MSKLKVAIVHDWMVGGGAERVVEEMLVIYPEATLYTSCITAQWREKLAGTNIITGYLDWGILQKTRKFLPVLRQIWFSNLDLTDYDLILSSSGAEAKGVHKLKPGTKHINYCHSPTHYYWVRYDEYIKDPGFGKGLNWLARLGLKLFIKPLRKWDYKAAQRPDIMIANSTCVQDRIKKYYGRDSVVIHPPVDTARFKLSTAKRSGFVVAGRQTPYKRIDLAVSACTHAGLPLKVIGRGPEHDKLVAMAGPTIEFLTEVKDSEIAGHFASARAFIFPNEDDFGIVPVEAMATGTPIVAYKKGGALDYVTNTTGMFFTHQGVQVLAETLKKADKHPWKEKVISKSAQKFSIDEFHSKLKNLIAKTL